MQKLKRLTKWGWKLKVSITTGISGKLSQRIRLLVSGLPQFPDQETTELNVRELFAEYELSTISKLEISESEEQGCLCFVEVAFEAETDRALLNVDGKERWGVRISVQPATAARLR